MTGALHPTSPNTERVFAMEREEGFGISTAHLAVSCGSGPVEFEAGCPGGGLGPHSLTQEGIEGGGSLQSKGESSLVWTLQLWTQMSVLLGFSQVPANSTHQDACLRSEARSPWCREPTSPDGAHTWWSPSCTLPACP